MKKNYAIFGLLLASAVAVNARQLPNGNFDGDWGDCKPDGENVVGKQPDGWMASNVYKMGMTKELVSMDDDRIQPQDETKHSVAMNNLYVGIWASFLKMGDTAPGYITLGKSWAYGDIANVGKPNDTSDGGAYGSIPFTYRPDAVSLYVKRTHPAEKPEEGDRFNQKEKASVIVYSWKGSTTSKVTTGLSTSQTVIDMVDREKDVLGMITDGVTKSEDFELVSKSENYIEGDITEWKEVVYPIEYLSDAVPEKINVILASSDYFNRAELGTGNQFWVDDVKFVYYSTLASVEIGGVAVENLTEGVNDLSGQALPAEDQIEAVAKSRFATVTKTVDAEAAAVTLTVTNQGGEDADGKTEHVYVLQFKKAAEAVEYPGYLNIEMRGQSIAENQAATISITDNGDGTCDFLLPDLTVGMPLGDIKLENVTVTEGEDDSKTYHKDKTQISLGVGKADVTLDGTIDASEKVDMTIDVVWNSLPISVKFTSEKQTSSVDAISETKATVFGTNGAVVVEGFCGTAEIYTADGRLVKSAAVEGNAEITVAKGLYLVRTGAAAQKVAVK